jgi:dTDP-glucose 4,6-dehydratase
MTVSATAACSAISLPEFLAEDFARLDGQIFRRCMQIDGHRLYLTGATGFFGKNILALLADLARRGAVFEVTALSRSPERFLADHPWCGNLKWLKWQKGEATAPWAGSGQFDLLLHAATDTVASAHLDKLAAFENILAATRQALSFAADHGVRRVLLSGSGAQYGSIPDRFADGVPEDSALGCDPTRSDSAYGEGKRVSELLAALYANRYDISVVNTRCFAFVGPGLALDGHFAIGNFLRDALLARPIKLASGGDAVRSYLYGTDLAVWLLLLMLEAARGTIVNVGSDDRIRIIDLARRVCDLVNPGLGVQIGEPKAGEQRHFYVPCIGVARRLGLDVWTDLDRAITRTALWYRTRQVAS